MLLSDIEINPGNCEATKRLTQVQPIEHGEMNRATNLDTISGP